MGADGERSGTSFHQTHFALLLSPKPSRMFTFCQLSDMLINFFCILPQNIRWKRQTKIVRKKFFFSCPTFALILFHRNLSHLSLILCVPLTNGPDEVGSVCVCLFLSLFICAGLPAGDTCQILPCKKGSVKKNHGAFLRFMYLSRTT